MLESPALQVRRKSQQTRYCAQPGCRRPSPLPDLPQKEYDGKKEQNKQRDVTTPKKIPGEQTGLLPESVSVRSAKGKRTGESASADSAAEIRRSLERHTRIDKAETHSGREPHCQRVRFSQEI